MLPPELKRSVQRPFIVPSTEPDAHALPVALPDTDTEPPPGMKYATPLAALPSVYVPVPEYDQFVEPDSVPLPLPAAPDTPEPLNDSVPLPLPAA